MRRIRAWLSRGDLPGAWLAFVGFALVTAGGWRLFGEPAAATTLLYVGAGLLVLGVLHPRIAQLKVGHAGVEVALVHDLRESGAPGLADAVEGSELPRIVTAYEVVRDTLRNDKEARTKLQDLLVERAADLAQRETLARAELESAFRQGTAAARVLILGLMQGDPRLFSVSVLRDAIEHSLTGNEQYQALRLAVSSSHRLGKPELDGLIAAAEASPYIGPTDRADTDSDRRRMLRVLEDRAADC